MIRLWGRRKSLVKVLGRKRTDVTGDYQPGNCFMHKYSGKRFSGFIKFSFLFSPFPKKHTRGRLRLDQSKVKITLFDYFYSNMIGRDAIAHAYVFGKR